MIQPIQLSVLADMVLPPASTARIRLSANSTRRARWDAKLGYFCRHPGPLPVSLHSLLPQGGAVGALSNVLLARVYPLLSIEKTLDGRKVVRGKRAEARAAAKYEFERQAWLESVYAEVSAEMQREQEEDARRQKGKRSAPDGGGNVRSFKRPKKSQSHSEYVGRVKDSILSHCGQTVEVEELSRLVDESGDPSEVQKLLTTSQVDMISAYRQESLERFQKELEDRVRQRIKQEEENLMSSDKNKDAACSLAGRKNRDVVTLLKVRLVDADQPVIAKSAVLTVWRPSEDVISLLGKEGTILNIYGLTANGVRSNFIQLSSGKHTRYKLKKSQAYTAHLMESTYSILRREILSQGFEDYKFNLGPGSKTSLPPFGEIDLVAIVIKVGAEPGKAKGQGFQYLYVAGSDASLLSIAFWGGIQEFAVEDFLHPGSVVAVLNLQWRRLHGLHKIATLQAVETSTFTLNPVEERLKKVMKDFMIEIKTEKQFQSNVAEFIKSCEQKLDAVLGADFKEVSSSSNKGSMSAESKLSPVSTLSVANSVENISPITPSVAARMKKLQMYEGFMEIPLPTYHLRKSASVEKAFHPPKKGLTPSTTSSHEIKVVETLTVFQQDLVPGKLSAWVKLKLMNWICTLASLSIAELYPLG
ncbi:breast cancer type 2 susceptibility protein homolog [Hetaerina americana]|uniref:breast cancer type 2 susceptibility protein homolog n=1 Tax=Hetaerina americana TaxID=62018 RepID=UPI003A7F5E35